MTFCRKELNARRQQRQRSSTHTLSWNATGNQQKRLSNWAIAHQQKYYLCSPFSTHFVKIFYKFIGVFFHISRFTCSSLWPILKNNMAFNCDVLSFFHLLHEGTISILWTFSASERVKSMWTCMNHMYHQFY